MVPPTRLHALSAGRHLPRTQFGGRIHSVFTRACNLHLEDSSLITLLSATYANLPQGIRISAPPGFYFADHLQPGQSFHCHAGLLTFQNAAISIDLRGAQPWHMDLRRRPADLSQPVVRQAWQKAWQAWQEAEPDAGLYSYAGPYISSLLQATKTGRLDDAVQAMAALIGLGPGLTPAGDDFIVGYLAGLWNTAAVDPARHTFVLDLVAQLRPLLDRTNDISRTYLNYALQGEVSEPLATLAQAIATGQEATLVLDFTQAALQVGSTSGAGGVFGLLLGLNFPGNFNDTGSDLSIVSGKMGSTSLPL